VQIKVHAEQHKIAPHAASRRGSDTQNNVGSFEFAPQPQ
jgi:hypothetical protein